MTEEQPVPVGDALPGISIYPLPDRWTPLSAIVLVKCLDEDGDPTWALRRTSGLSDEELLGALVIRTELLRRYLLDLYGGEDDDD